MICPITGSEMRRLYRGPVRDGINGAYVGAHFDRTYLQFVRRDGL